jgi:ATP-dependent exoDNAse (exonuclease V) beta subunit
MIDRDARETIANDLDSTLIVEAAAGTGKTTELVNRILRILAAGKTTIGKIVAVTFTEKAAGELKLRLREALERERMAAAGDARARLDEALTKLEEAHVSTIHGFCADLLRERPVEARVDPLFTVLTEAQAERLFDEAFSGWLQEQLANPHDGLRRALRRSAGWSFARRTPSQDGPVDRLRQAAWDLAEWRDFPEPWTRRPFSRSDAIENLVREVQAFADLTENPSYAKDNLFLDTAPVRHLSQEIRTQTSIGVHDEDGWEARLVDLSRHRSLTNARHGRGPGYRQGVSRAVILAALDDLRAHLDQFRMDADADLAALLQEELASAIARYEHLKRRSGALDFLDLLLKARGLMTTSTELRGEFQERFTHVFVDEFQDTDPLQAEILLLLTANDPANADWRTVVPAPGRLFIVGDPKQSIYRFRRADVGVFRDVCDRLKRAGATQVELTASFRSVPEIQSCVNAAFTPIMTGDELTLQADYVPLSQYRPAITGQPAVVALPVPEPYGQRNLSMIAIERSLPDAVGAFVEWLVNESKWKVTGRGGSDPEPVQARHVCVLFRRFLSFGQDMTQPYVRALEARGVPHVLVGGKTFHDREEVDTLRAALSAVEWPDDELSVFATLRGAFFAIGDEELLEWRHGLGLPFHPFHWRQGSRELPADALRGSPIVGALELLRELHTRRNYVPIAQTIQRLLDRTRAHVGFVLRGGGEQALANVLHVAELARQYEMDGGISFRGFVDELRAAAEGAQSPEAPILEEGSDGVRMMTVHKAKGLEFPIVILADPTCKMSRIDASRWLDPERPLCALKIAGLSPVDLLLHGAEELAREQAEGARLTYVAATRARDVLVVPVIGDAPYEGGWLDPLMPAVYPPESSRRTAGRAPGCPQFASKDSVLVRPDGDPARSTTVSPGLHRFSNSASPIPEPRAPDPGTYSVTWWDPRSLSLGAESSFGLTRDDLIVKDGDMFAVEDRLAEYERWKTARAAVINGAKQPTLRVATATAWARDRQSEAGFEREDIVITPIETVALERAKGRPAGQRFGTLVHATLATVPLEADRATIARVAETQARILGATDEERDAAAHAVADVLDHPLLLRARECARDGRCHREVPITWIAPDGLLLEGTIDLAFDDGAELVVLDFKTDRELSADFDQYRRQVDVYCRAISAVRGKPAKGILMKV